MTFVDRLNLLLKREGLTRAKFLENIQMGKNSITYWEKNNTMPNLSTLTVIANYFGVSVDYLRGTEDMGDYVDTAVDMVLAWLENHGYQHTTENNSVTITKDGKSVHRTEKDFSGDCLLIKRESMDGFNLAMKDWERRRFVVDESCTVITENENVISSSPNASITISSTDISKQERELIEMYRDFSLTDQIKLISYALKLKNGEI